MSSEHYLDERVVLAVAELEHLLGRTLREEGRDHEVDKAALSEDEEHEEVAVTDGTSSILHLVYRSLHAHSTCVTLTRCTHTALV